MMGESASTVHRILVAFDAAEDIAAFEAAAHLAGALGAPLEGLFVEDINLLRMARLPFIREITLASASVRPLQAKEVERALRLRAAEAERTLRAGAPHGIEWSLRIVRGTMARVAATLEEVDFRILGRPRGLARESAGATGPVMVVFDEAASAQRALAAARAIALGGQRELTILLPVGEQAVWRSRAVQALDAMGTPPERVRMVQLPVTDPATLLILARRLRASLLVLAAIPQQRLIETLLEAPPCPILIAR